MREIHWGDWWQLGNHFLYCGEVNSPDFVKNLPKNIALLYDFEPNLKELVIDFWVDKVKNILLTTSPKNISEFLKNTTQQAIYQTSFAHYSKDKKWLTSLLFSKITQENSEAFETEKLEKSYSLLHSLLKKITQEGDIIIDVNCDNEDFMIMLEKMNRITYTAQKNTIICKKIIENWENLTEQIAQKIQF